MLIELPVMANVMIFIFHNDIHDSFNSIHGVQLMSSLATMVIKIIMSRNRRSRNIIRSIILGHFYGPSTELSVTIAITFATSKFVKM